MNPFTAIRFHGGRVLMAVGDEFRDRAAGVHEADAESSVANTAKALDSAFRVREALASICNCHAIPFRLDRAAACRA